MAVEATSASVMRGCLVKVNELLLDSTDGAWHYMIHSTQCGSWISKMNFTMLCNSYPNKNFCPQLWVFVISLFYLELRKQWWFSLGLDFFRNGYSLSRWPSFCLCVIRGTNTLRPSRSARNEAPSCIQWYQIRFPSLFSPDGEVRLSFSSVLNSSP